MVLPLLITILIILLIILTVVLWLGTYIVVQSNTNIELTIAQKEYDKLVELIIVTGSTIRQYEYSNPHKDYTEIVEFYERKSIDLKYFLLCNKQPINKHFNFEEFNKTVFK